MSLGSESGRRFPILQEIDKAVRDLDLAKRAIELDARPEFPRSEFRELGRRHLLGLRIRRELGGRGLSMSETGAALCRLGYLAGTTFAKLALQPEFSSVLAEQGSEELRAREFDPLLRGERLIGNHITEPGAGSDAGAIEMTATPAPGGYRLDGVKSEVAFATEADSAIVYARTPGSGSAPAGITAFVLPQTDPNIERSVRDDLGERWMRRGSVRYRGVFVETGRRIGAEGAAFGYLKDELTRDRLLLAMIYLGVGRSSFDEVVELAGSRQTFGRPLHRHEAVGFPLVEDWARLDAAQLYVERALDRADVGRSVDAEAALAKWLATDTALTAIDHAIQFSGGRGYSSELRHGQRWRDVRSGALAHGPSEIMHLVAGQGLWPKEPRATERATGRPVS